MDCGPKATDIVRRAERELVALAAEAAADRDYAGATAVLALAQQVADAVADIVDAAAAPTRSTEVSASPGRIGSPAKPGPDTDQIAPSPPERAAPPAARSAGGGRTPPARIRNAEAPKYPRFRREGDTLVKVGYSKTDRATYEHRSPRDTLRLLVAKISQFGGGGRRFTTEQLMPLRDETGGDLPDYQSYLCLAWLVRTGLLERHGRQGYTVREPGDLEPAVDAAWDRLLKR